MTAISIRRLFGRQHGFSQLEICVALGVMAVILATGAPRIPRLLASYELSNAVEELANDMRGARMRAIMHNTREHVRFTTASYQIWRELPPAPGGAATGNYTPDGGTTSLPSGVMTFRWPGDPLFDSRGLAASDYWIWVWNEYGTLRTINVNPIGRISID